MARLIRANSATPTVANNDDYRLLRYATCGYNGVLENYGNECISTVTGSDFKINSGVIVYQGVDTEILTAGETITIDNISGTQYYVIYLEIDLSDSGSQTATIKSSYGTSDYPVISAGDDLTTTPNGVANFELYRFEGSSGVISNVVAQFTIIEVGNVLHAENADLATNATNATNGISKTDGSFQKLEKNATSNIMTAGTLIVPQYEVVFNAEISSTPLESPSQYITVATGITPVEGDHFKIFGYVPLVRADRTYKNPFVFELYYRTTVPAFGGNNGILIPINVVNTLNNLFTWRTVGTNLTSSGQLDFWIAEPGTTNQSDNAIFATGVYITLTKIYKIIE